MSEYQYYEFLAVDRALNERQLAELRALSTRARITPTSFVNTYQWGNFPGPAEQDDGGVLRRLPLLRELEHPRADDQAARAAAQHRDGDQALHWRISGRMGGRGARDRRCRLRIGGRWVRRGRRGLAGIHHPHSRRYGGRRSPRPVSRMAPLRVGRRPRRR